MKELVREPNELGKGLVIELLCTLKGSFLHISHFDSCMGITLSIGFDTKNKPKRQLTENEKMEFGCRKR